MKLLAPQTYIEASDELINRICNGCGPNGILGKLVPEHLAGADISTACNIHDWMYQEGEDKQKADLYFLANMIYLCSKKSRWLLPIRALMAVHFYLAVHYAGNEYFAADEAV